MHIPSQPDFDGGQCFRGTLFGCTVAIHFAGSATVGEPKLYKSAQQVALCHSPASNRIADHSYSGEELLCEIRTSGMHWYLTRDRIQIV